MKMPSELFAPGSVGDELANDLARTMARVDGIEPDSDGEFRIYHLFKAPYRARAELAITWMLKPEVRERLGGMK